MLAIYTLVFVYICSVEAYVSQDAVLNGTDLVLAFLVHRHGDRTPVPQYAYLSDKPDVLDKLTMPLGYGQLTDIFTSYLDGTTDSGGLFQSLAVVKVILKRDLDNDEMNDAHLVLGYELGKFIRERYSKHLSPWYNRSEIYIRSTDSTRAKMTALVAMAGVYPPIGRGWSDNLRWVPVPYTTMPLQYDFTMGMNCPRFFEHFDEIANSNHSEMERHGPVVDKLSTLLKQDLTATPVKIYFAYDVFTSQTSMGLPVKQSIKKIMPEIKEAADTAFDLLFGNDTVIPIQAGLLLKEFFEVCSEAVDGNPSPKVRVYSAHDTNVYAFESISRVRPRQGAPAYAAVYALELRRVRETGRYVVLPIYVKSPGEPAQYLQVEGCEELLCDLQRFHEITSPYLLDVDEWKRRCKYDDNALFNSNGFE